MTETAIETPRLWTPEGFREDAWHHADILEDTSGNEAVILPLAAFRTLDAGKRKAMAGRLGVLLAPGEAVETIVPFLANLALVALAFPAFNDGRSFSKAELLRRRHGYSGPLRAVGDVLIDQIPHMLRTGFTEFEVKNPTTLRRLAEGHLGGLPGHYQPAAKPADKPSGYSWRRKPAA
jgi:uncharacterized protein (DUF934 family)